MMTLLKIILIPFSIVYSTIISLRNLFFDKNVFKSTSVDAKVISIGNITVGGSGKTPAVLLISKLLKLKNKKIGVLSRGYRRNSKGFLLVSDNNELISDVNTAGDELYLTAQELQIPTAACENRVDGAKELINLTGIDTLVLDDAFQHRWINRDCDIVMADQRFLNKTGSLEHCSLPSGIMREPFNSLYRADIIIINRKFSEKKAIPEKLKKYFDKNKLFFGYYTVKGIYDVKNHKKFNMEEFIGQRSLIVSGIAKPFSFLHLLENNGIDFANKLLFPDHKNYTLKEVEEIRKKFYSTNAFSVLTTQKDAVKLTEFSTELDDIDIYYIKIELAIDNQFEFENRIEKLF